MNKQQPSLIFCILMDLVGYATYAIPFFGEIGDHYLGANFFHHLHVYFWWVERSVRRCW